MKLFHKRKAFAETTLSLRIRGWVLVCCGASYRTQDSMRGHLCLLSDVLPLNNGDRFLQRTPILDPKPASVTAMCVCKNDAFLRIERPWGQRDGI